MIIDLHHWNVYSKSIISIWYEYLSKQQLTIHHSWWGNQRGELGYNEEGWWNDWMIRNGAMWLVAGVELERQCWSSGGGAGKLDSWFAVGWETGRSIEGQTDRTETIEHTSHNLIKHSSIFFSKKTPTYLTWCVADLFVIVPNWRQQSQTHTPRRTQTNNTTTIFVDRWDLGRGRCVCG